MDVIDVDIRSFSYKGEDLAALKNVRFSVERGELVVLTGNSGAGCAVRPGRHLSRVYEIGYLLETVQEPLRAPAWD